MVEKSEIRRDYIECLAKEVVSPILRGSGFNKSGLRWTRERGRFLDVLEIQKSKGQSEEHQRFTINLGVFVPEFFEAIWQRPPKSSELEVGSAVRSRIGSLLEEENQDATNDKWWEIENSDDYEVSKIEISDIVNNAALHFFDQINNMNDINDFIEGLEGWERDYEPNQMFLALSKREIGDIDGFYSILESISGIWKENADRLKDENKLR